MKTIPKTWVYCTLFVINIFLVSCSSSVKEERAQYDTSEIEQPAPTEEMAAEEPELNTESYAYIQENGFKNTSNNPLSTFSIDVDNASYTNTRRFLKQNGMLPPPDAVRIEEFINYFDYSYPIPSAEETFSIQHELGECMWNKSNYLLKLGIK